MQEKASTSQALEAQDKVQDVSSVNIEDIKCWIQIGRDKAKTLLEFVGMDDLLKHNKQWEKVNTGISAMELVSTEELVDDEFEDENEDL